MAKRAKTVGQGITERRVLQHDGADFDAGIWAWAQNFRAFPQGQRAWLERLSKTDAEDLAKIAREALDMLSWMEKHLAAGDPRAACARAFDAGCLAGQAEIKASWERSALAGRSVLAGGRLGGSGRRGHRKVDAAAVRLEYGKLSQAMTQAQRQAKVAAMFRISVRTVRRYLNENS